MALPATIGVTINFSDGPTYGYPFTIGDPVKGILGVSELAGTNTAGLIVDYSAQTTQTSIRRGRDLMTDTYNAGTASVKILDPNGDFNPQNTSSPIYGFLKPLRKIQITATYSGTTYYLFSGYTSEYRYTYPTGQEIGYVTIVSYDAFKIFNLAAISTVTDAGAGQDTGTRINRILSELSWPNSMRDIDTGDTICSADSGQSRVALSAIRAAEFSELGAFYMSPDGNAIFKSRSSTIETLDDTPTVFNQTGGIPYANIKFAFDDKLIINQANIQRYGSSNVQSHTDAASVDTYFLHSTSAQNLPIATDEEAMNLATTYVNSRKDTTIRIDSMTLDLTTPDYAAGVLAALSLDYFSNVTISNIQPNGDTITKTIQVQGVAHDIQPNKWFTTFTTMEPITDGFIIGNAEYGILGVNRLAW
jgi:hypothetical protein